MKRKSKNNIKIKSALGDGSYEENNKNYHAHNIRKWIHHRFNEKGIDGIISKKHSHKQHKFTNDVERQIVDIASANPRSFRLGFSA